MPLTSCQRQVLAALLALGEAKHATYTPEQIAAASGLLDSTVAAAANELVALGLVKRTFVQSRVGYYVLFAEARQALAHEPKLVREPRGRLSGLAERLMVPYRL